MKPNATQETPLFSKRLRKTQSDGSYSGVRQGANVAIYRDRIEIDGRKLYRPYIRDVRVFGSVLHVLYVMGDGRPVEEYFANPTFRAKTGAKELAAMIAVVQSAWGPISAPAVFRGDAAPVEIAIRRVDRDTGHGGLPRITVYSSRVAFPLICPTCAEPATKLGAISIAGFFERGGWWAVPVCERHRNPRGPIYPERWTGSEVKMLFANAAYADAFAAINEERPDAKLVASARSSRLAFAIDSGTKYVLYQYVISAVYFSALTPSDPIEIPLGHSRLTPGLRYSLATLLLGWWAIPGIVFTIRALVTNSRGGMDVTENVASLVKAVPLSPRGV
ncbi:MAG: hypothetical protein ABI837_02300 [Acidobacteriota bacterium]